MQTPDLLFNPLLDATRNDAAHDGEYAHCFQCNCMEKKETQTQTNIL